MATVHPDFSMIQRRLRRLDPSWYPSSVSIDDIWGPGMAAGIDAALSALEAQRGLGPLVVPPPATLTPAGMPPKFAFLYQDPQPPLMVRLALEHVGLLERPGTPDNPVILGWADEVARADPTAYNRWAVDFYNDDAIPWCGLFMAMIAVRSSQGRAERLPPDKYLAALSWQNWGVSVPVSQAAVGDVMVMRRSGGGHVCINVGTAKGERSFFGLGANQSHIGGARRDTVGVAEFDIDRLVAVRRPPYLALPPGARRVLLSPGGVLSVDEA